MPNRVSFNGKNIIEPGAYGRIVSGIPARPDVISSGNLLIIDTGNQVLQDTTPLNVDYPIAGPTVNPISWGGGAGINGELTAKKNSVYRFDSIGDFKRFIKGGMWWDLADYIFNPSFQTTGPQTVYYVRAATTTAGTLTFNLTATTNGILTIKTKDEGYIANGTALGTTDLRRGIGAKIIPGIVDSTKFIIQFFVGTFRGYDILASPNNQIYGDIKPEDCLPELILQTTEFKTVADFAEYVRTSPDFNNKFQFVSNTAAGTISAIVGANLSAGYNMSIGATESFTANDLDETLRQITELDYSFMLADRWHTDAQSAQNVKLLTHVNTESEFKRFIVIGAGNNQTYFDNPPLALTGTGSLQTAVFYNSPYVMAVHSGIKMPHKTGEKTLPSIYHAALVCGRLCGIEPQTPLTYKDLRLNGLVHELDKLERERSLEAGLLHTKYVPLKGWVVNQGINTLQLNDFTVNSDGTSPEISVMRIAEQLNKELSILARKAFVGGNLNTSSANDVLSFTQAYLTRKTATKTVDNLIFSFKDVRVELRNSDSWWVEYAFVPNYPINKLFFTGIILDVSITAQ